MGFFSDIFGGGSGGGASNLQGFKLPKFKSDTDYRDTQKYLKDYGMDMLSGDIPDYYKGIGESDSQQFNRLLDLMKGDVLSSVESSAAASGRRGGAVQSIASEKIGDLSTKMRYADYERGIEGKKFLFQQGRGITEGVRSAGLSNQAQENNFSLSRAGLDLQYRQLLDQQEEAGGGALGNLLSFGLDAIGGADGDLMSLLPEGLGAAGGFLIGGPAGAVTGWQLGSKVPDSWLGGGEKKDTPKSGPVSEFGGIDINDYMLEGAVA